MASRFPDIEERLGRVDFRVAGQAVFNFFPTLVIGLGGSGVQAVRRLKRIQRARYGTVDVLQYLGIDTDQGSFAATADLAPLAPNETHGLYIANATGVLDEMRSGLRQELAEWFPTHAQVRVLENAEGAAGIRPAGRFALFADFTNLYQQRLAPACQTVLGLQQQVRVILEGLQHGIQPAAGSPRVFIVNSICGGTGSSLFLDVALLVRRIFQLNALDCDITGVFFLPSVFRYESIEQAHLNNMEANAYAALKELEFLCDPDIHERRLTVTYPEIGQVPISRPIYDECYLVEISNAAGSQLANAAEVSEMTARSLCVHIGTPMGASARAARLNYDPILLTNPCLETRKPRLMNSLATASLRVPIEDLGLYCCLRAARAVIQDHLINGQTSADAMTKQVNSLLLRLHLEERGDQDRLLERLLWTEDETVYPLGHGLDRAALEAEADRSGQRGEKGQARYAASWLERHLDALPAEVVPDVRAVVRRNRPKVLEAAAEGIRAELDRLLREQGLSAAQALLQELITSLETIETGLGQELKDHDATTSALGDEVRAKAAYLQGWGGVFDRLFHNDDDEQAMADGLRRLDVLRLTLIQQEARRGAVELLNGQPAAGAPLPLLPRLRAWKQAADDALRGLGKAVDTIVAVNAASAPQRHEPTAYPLDQPVIATSEYPAWYDRLELDIAQHAGAAWEAFRAEVQAADRPVTLIDATARMAALADHPDTLVDRIATVCVGAVLAGLHDQAQFLKVVQQRDEQPGDSVQSLLERLASFTLDNCKPFWSTRAPRGQDRYLQHVVVTVPSPPGTEEYRTVERTLSAWLAKLGVARVATVSNANPFALEVAVQVYGARAYYLSSVGAMRQRYQAKEQAGAPVLQLLHLDRRWLPLMPDLFPDREGEFGSLFAWAIAYGYLAKRGKFYYLGIKERKGAEGQMLPTPKYQTDWEPAVGGRMDEDWRGTPQQRYESADQLGDSREAAFRALVGNEAQIEALEAVRDQYMIRFGEARVRSEIEAYVEAVEKWIDEHGSSNRELYQMELDALRGWLRSLS